MAFFKRLFVDSKKALLKRLGAELDIDEFKGEAFDLLASAYHKVRLQRAAKRMMKTRRRYEELMARDSREVLQEALQGSAGLDDVVESLGGQARVVLMEALEHVDEIVAPPPVKPVVFDPEPLVQPVSVKRKPAL